MKAIVVAALFTLGVAGCFGDPPEYLQFVDAWETPCDDYAPHHLTQTYLEWQQPVKDAKALGWSNVAVDGPYGDGLSGERWRVSAECIVEVSPRDAEQPTGRQTAEKQSKEVKSE